MKSKLLAAFLVFPLAGCAVHGSADRAILRFYEQAKQRQKNFDPNQSVPLEGLKADYGVLPGSGGAGTIEQSALVVTDADPHETHAVQVIVEPRVAGEFLDPAGPSGKFLMERERDIRHALQTHRYAAVYLLPKPPSQEETRGDPQ